MDKWERRSGNRSLSPGCGACDARELLGETRAHRRLVVHLQNMCEHTHTHAHTHTHTQTHTHTHSLTHTHARASAHAQTHKCAQMRTPRARTRLTHARVRRGELIRKALGDVHETPILLKDVGPSGLLQPGNGEYPSVPLSTRGPVRTIATGQW